MGSWRDTFAEQLRGDIFIDQQHKPRSRFDLARALCDDRREMSRFVRAATARVRSFGLIGTTLAVGVPMGTK